MGLHLCPMIKNNLPQHQKQVTLYKNLVEPIGTLTIPELIDVIKSTRYKAVQENIQLLFSLGEKDKANEQKKKLYSFSASCQCSLWRCLDNVTIYNSYLIFDLDHLADAELKRIWLLLKADAYVMAAFRSPSWQGIKFIIETDAPLQDHKTAYEKAAAYYERLLGTRLDRSGSDVCRICFIGYDPWAYVKAHQVFIIPPPLPLPLPKPTPRFPIRPSFSFPRPSEATTSIIFERCVVFLNKYQQYEVGNRNNYSYSLARKLKRFNIDYDDALAMMLSRYDLPERELTCCVRSAYKRK
jgi:hypothetical protein